MNSLMIKEKLKNLDMHYTHPSYFLEKKLLRQIKMGLVSDVEATLDEINTLQRASLARDSLRSIKNSLIASCTLFTRAAIESGVDAEDSFDLSDVFIKEIETYDNEAALLPFEYTMANAFINLIQTNRLNRFPIPFQELFELFTKG
jgi:two-component system, response regulator YesN